MAPSKSKSKSRKKQLSSTRPTFPTNSKSNSTSTSTSTPSTSLPSNKPLPIPSSRSRKTSRPSSRTTQSIITTHHILNKRLHSAIAVHGEESQEVREIRDEIERRGGLRVYQDASFTGQMGERGGDSSGVLVGWLREDEVLGVGLGDAGHRTGNSTRRGKGNYQGREGRDDDSDGVAGAEDAGSEITAHGGRFRKRKRVDEDHDSGDEPTTTSNTNMETPHVANGQSAAPTQHHDPQPPKPLRILEIGALSPTNHLSTLRLPNTKVEIRRIDLRSNHPQIEEQDFMTLDPQEVWQGEVGYDVLSLSLVLNFVGDARGRGEMLGWTRGFLRRRGGEGSMGVGKDNGSGRSDAGGAVGESEGEGVNEERGGSGNGGVGGVGDGSRAAVQDTDDDDDNTDNDDTDADTDNHNDSDNNSSGKDSGDEIENTENTNTLLPALFLVLPLPTLTNSRYLTEPHLTKIMAHLRYTLTRVKRSSKVYYSLWRYEGECGHSPAMSQGSEGRGVERKAAMESEDGGDPGIKQGKRFAKRELRGGRERNNFAIVLDA